MGKRRPERTARRKGERLARQLVRDRERLAALAPGGSPERPIAVASSAVIELRAQAQPCPQCEGSLRVDDHQAESATLRRIAMTCVRCGVARSKWFRITTSGPN